MTTSSMKQLFNFVLIIIPLFSFTQTPKEILTNYIEKYPNDELIYLEDILTVNIKLNKNEEIEIIKNIKEKTIVLDEKASLYSSGSVTFSDLMELQSLNAKTLYPDEKKYKEIPIDKALITTKDNLSSSVFYDDSKESSFTYPMLVQGAQKVLEYQINVKEPRFLGGFYFQSGIPSEKAEIEIITDAGINIGFKLFNTDTFNITYTKTEQKGKVYHKWTAKDIPKFKSDKQSLNAAYFIPHIILFITDYTTSEGNKKMLSSTDDLHNWYYNLVKDVNKKDNSTLKTIVDSLTLNVDSEIEKVRIIYDWVQTHIKYVAFEDNYNGFIPREAVDIYDKRFGDCKDMSSIITEMLEIANIETYLTWIGTRDIPYSYNEVFTTNADNHMIATYIDKDGKKYYLDATSSYLPFGMVSEFTQGKQAMIDQKNGTYILTNLCKSIIIAVPRI